MIVTQFTNRERVIVLTRRLCTRDFSPAPYFQSYNELQLKCPLCISRMNFHFIFPLKRVHCVYSSSGWHLIWLPCPLIMARSRLSRDSMRFLRNFTKFLNSDMVPLKSCWNRAVQFGENLIKVHIDIEERKLWYCDFQKQRD